MDRVDNDRGYFPGNLRWATASEQRFNRRKGLFRSRNGVDHAQAYQKALGLRSEGHSQQQIARAVGVARSTVACWLAREQD